MNTPQTPDPVSGNAPSLSIPETNGTPIHPLNKKELAKEIHDYLEYINTIPNADTFNVAMIETVLKGFATWLGR